MFRAVFLPIIRSFSAVQRHWYSLCSSVTEFYQDQDGIVPLPLYSWEAPDDGQKDCPKHVQLLLPIKLELGESVGFIYNESVTMHGHTILQQK
jgi:hypothetical protein